jgi:hypothetical protein
MEHFLIAVGDSVARSLFWVIIIGAVAFAVKWITDDLLKDDGKKEEEE